jgi:hypothetical protein
MSPPPEIPCVAASSRPASRHTTGTPNRHREAAVPVVTGAGVVCSWRRCVNLISICDHRRTEHVTKVPMPKSKVRKKNDFAVNSVSRTPVKVKAGPSSMWFVVLFISLMLIGLAWLLVFQLAASGFDTPSALQWMADLGPWNYAIAFAFMITGLLLTMRWR